MLLNVNMLLTLDHFSENLLKKVLIMDVGEKMIENVDDTKMIRRV